MAGDRVIITFYLVGAAVLMLASQFGYNPLEPSYLHTNVSALIVRLYNPDIASGMDSA
jgi:hypothetical protein